MAQSVIMPKSGMAMEEGIIVSWLKKVGETVSPGEAIATIETDKAVLDLEAEAAGTLIAILREAGDRVPVTQIIAWIGKPGEAVPESPSAEKSQPAAAATAPSPGVNAGTGSASPGGGRVAATPAARRAASEAGIDLGTVPSANGGPVAAEDVLRYVRKDATPLAARMAEAAGLDPAVLAREGSGRVRKADVEAAAAGASPGERLLKDRPRSGDGPRPDSRVPFTSIQRITGQRLARSHVEIPSVTSFAQADVTSLLAARESLNASGGLKISLNDLTVRACAKALAANPRVNAVVDGDGLILKGNIDIGIAVATETGLLVPVLRDADRLSLPEQSRRSRDLAERARTRRLRPEEFEGGTFTVSNIGMYGISAFTPIINPPQVGILGVGAVEERLALDLDGRPVVRKVLNLCFTFDHRALDGAESSAFLAALRDLLESPIHLVL